MKSPKIPETKLPYSGYVASFGKDAAAAPTSVFSAAPTVPAASTTTRTGRPSLLGGV